MKFLNSNVDFVLLQSQIQITLDDIRTYTLEIHRGSVAGSVIQATGTVEFENGLWTGVLPGGCWGP